MRATIAPAAAGAFVAALGHTLVIEWLRYGMQRPMGAAIDFPLYSLIGYLALFTAFAVPLAVLAAVTSESVGRWIAWFATASLAALSLLLLVPHLYWQALLVVALGVGKVAADAAARDPRRSAHIARRTALVAAGLQLAIVGGDWGARRLELRRLEASRGDARDGAPNVVLLILDTVRARNLSIYGYPRPTTPNLMRLFADSGVTFAHAFTAGSWSAPSHGTMLTGMWGSEHRADYRSRLRRDVPTLPELLTQRGYATGSFVSNVVYAGRPTGFGRGFAHVEDFQRSVTQILWSTSILQTPTGRGLYLALIAKSPRDVVEALRHPNLHFESYVEQPRGTPEVVDGFWRWRSQRQGRPYFAMLNFLDAHDPNPEGRFKAAFNDGKTEVDRYDGSIAYADSVVGALADRLREEGELDRTLFIVTADHGELIGEHGLRGHTVAIYQQVMRIPLLMRGPGVPRGMRVEREVSNRDLASTILDVVDGGKAREPRLPGTTLRMAWTPGREGEVSPVLLETTKGINMPAGDLRLPGAIRGAADSAWYYIRYGDGREELFRWREDTNEVRNLIATPEGRAAAATLRDRIARAFGRVPAM